MNNNAEASNNAAPNDISGSLFFVLTAFLMAYQIGIYYWRTYAFQSYRSFSFLGFALIPLTIAIIHKIWFFVLSWAFFFPIFLQLFRYSRERPVQPETPKKIYWIFYQIYYFTLYLTFLGAIVTIPSLLFSLKFNYFTTLGFHMLFYGVYYGLINRDLANLSTNRLASSMGFCQDSSSLDVRTPVKDMCLICRASFSPTDESFSRLASSQGDASEHRLFGIPGLAVIRRYGSEFLSRAINSSQEMSRKVVLNCGDEFHEFCIRGWLIVGKRETCPYCLEKVTLRSIFSSPWDETILWSEILNSLRYLLVWYPLTFVLMGVLIRIFG
ncbi:RING finger protein 121-like isoform X2 [Schistocerca gregaria]|uniref:RING finger protein 121-like isoform X2 n=1 Tax=Schistocerca gregaria TaxID=7010 RepID=UPI00211DFF39|nr:RING finger protein 121-like isoform X2 [Schistocerca gregaria]XP_049849174.1 RING finger protein 121-like isoform X2 [Schistocerca gregaria]